MTEKAWMIRNDNLVIPIKTIHPYGKPKFAIMSKENIEVLSFLYKYGNNQEIVKQYFVVYFAYFITKTIIEHKLEKTDYEKIINYLIELESDSLWLENKKFTKFWNLYQNDIIKYLKTGFKKEDIKYINQAINNELNQTFLRARFGGLYNSCADNQGIYFRISSGGFDWNNTIYSFLEKYQRELGIKTVTIVRDKESTGSGAVYKTNKSIAIEQMPVDSFWNESEGKIPELEKFNTKEEDLYRRGPRMIIEGFLKQGKSLNDFKLIPKVIGNDELYDQYHSICEYENHLPVFSKKLH